MVIFTNWPNCSLRHRRIFPGNTGFFDSRNNVCETNENLSRKNFASRWHLASRLLKARHEDGMDGMDRNGGSLRQVGRQLDCQDWPLAAWATDGVAKIILEI